MVSTIMFLVSGYSDQVASQRGYIQSTSIADGTRCEVEKNGAQKSTGQEEPWNLEGSSDVRD